MKRLGFAFNPTSEAALELRERALGWASVRGLEAWSAQAGEYEQLLEELPRTDALVVLGGDGTFLRAARGVAAVDVPILGINTGKVGFLSKAEPEQLERVLEQVAAGRFRLEPRMTLEATLLDPSGRETGRHVALNDAAVVRGSQARVVRLEVDIDDSHLATYIADGLVLATPTGSTAYSFSAGGPILDPTSRNLVVTPIAAYLAAVRSVVVSPRHVVSVRIVDAYDCLISIDGREDHPLGVGDAVRVRAREEPIRFIEPEGAAGFWDLLRQKAELLPS
ncbi:MAG TPA: NAD(+)/NADH kinase [Candidatus Limnocylindrales bacterium]|nr:NAD(+)/NADH kinase [Candidatus Limnocylindrales bacterium]